MSKKTVGTVLGVASVGLMLFGGPLGAVAAFGTKIGIGAVLSAGLALGSSLLMKPGGSGRASAAASGRLHATLDPNAPRKIVFGRTAMATDIRYQAFTGADQEYYHQIVCVASHEVEAIEEIWFDSDLAWSASGGVAAKYSGYLQITTRHVGTSANGIAIDSNWTSACTLTGCAYFHARFKLTGNSKKAESPFAQSIPSRLTVRGKGAKVYDPRFDSTAGGSGPQRIADQSTWAFSTAGVESGRVPALQELWYLFGWRINNKLALGRGIPAQRFETPSFITSANICDETVTRAAGGTEPRYRSDGVFSEADDPSTVISNLCGAMNAVLRDAGGKIALHVLKNDLATPKVAFTDDDIVGDESWKQTPSIDESFNVVRGRYTDPSDAALYQLIDSPEVSIPSVDGIERIDTYDSAMVQSASQKQRLDKQRLQRAQYAGVYSATYNARAWQASVGDVVTQSHRGLGWTNKLFRVAAQSIRADGTVPMVFQEENAAIYAWDAEEQAAVTAAAATAYDPLKAPVIKALSELVTVGRLTNESHTVPTAADGTGASFVDAGGTFQVFFGTTDVTTQATFSIPGGIDAGAAWTKTQNGLTLTLNETTGVYSLSGTWTSDSETFTLQAVYGGVALPAVYSISKAKAGTPGPAGGTGPGGPVVAISATEGAFVFIDGVATNAAQSITLTATKQNTSETVNWTTSPAVTLTTPGTDQRALSITNFGTNRQVVVTATGATSGAKDVFTIVRLDRSTAEAGATRNANERALNRNSAFVDGHTGWISGAGSPSRNGAVSVAANSPDATRGSSVLTLGSYTYERSEQLAVTPGETLYLAYRIKTTANRSDANAPSWLLGIEWSTAIGAAPGSGTYPINAQYSVAAGAQAGVVAIVVPAGQVAANAAVTLDFSNAGAGATGIVDYLEIHRDEPGSDATAQIVGAATISIDYDSSGTTSSQLPKVSTYKLMRQGADVTAATTWSVSTVSGTISASIGASNGALSIASMGSNEARLRVAATYAGLTRPPLEVIVTKNPALPPAGGGGPGGSGSANYDTTFATVTSSSYTADAAPIGGPITVSTGAAGTLSFTGNLTFYSDYAPVVDGTYTAGAAGKWRFRLPAGAWADVAAETASSASASNVVDSGTFSSSGGALSAAASKTGLTANTSYEVAWFARRSGGSGNLNFTGTISVQGS